MCPESLHITIKSNQGSMRLVGGVICWLLLSPAAAQAKVARDTVFTSAGDRVILTYELTNSGNRTTVRFIGQQKKLGKANARKYKDLSKVAVMFFDRTGNYGDDVTISNMVPEAFMLPPGVRCEKSHDGFYLVQSEPELKFTVKSRANISIPVYLAYKSKKGRYVLFAKSGGLDIALGARERGEAVAAKAQTVSQTIVSTAELEAADVEEIKVLESLSLARKLIAEAAELPFSDNLLDEVSYLRQKRREITNDALLAEISDVLDRYEAKKKSLEDEDAAEQMAMQRAEDIRAQREAQSIKAQNDSIAAAQQLAAEKEKKRNFWMVIGGIILAVLAFVGNQVMQGVRNRNNQKRMISIQQDMVERAEAEAKRFARNSVMNKAGRMENAARRKASEAIRKRNTLNVNGKSKNASI